MVTKTDSLSKAIGKWSEVVNKSLLEITNAIGIPLIYKDSAVFLQLTFSPGATMEFTAAKVGGRDEQM